MHVLLVAVVAANVFDGLVYRTSARMKWVIFE
jgi:hypothetical protein